MRADPTPIVLIVGAMVLLALGGTPFGMFAALTLVAIIAMLVFSPATSGSLA